MNRMRNQVVEVLESGTRFFRGLCVVLALTGLALAADCGPDCGCGGAHPEEFFASGDRFKLVGPAAGKALASTGSLLALCGADHTLTLHPGGKVCSLEIDPVLYASIRTNGADTVQLQQMSQMLYGWLGDDFDFLFFNDRDPVRLVSYFGRHSGVRNDTAGIGSSMFDNSASYGSAGRLQSAIHFSYAEGIRNGPSIHELMHRFANRLSDIPNAGAHWGFSSVNGHLGGWKPGTLVDLGGGVYDADGSRGPGFGTFANGGNSLLLSPLEMYLMGLAGSSEVADIKVADNGAFVPGGGGTFTADAIRTVSIADIIATEGARVPAFGAAPTNWTGALVVLTERPLDEAEWSQFSDVADWFSLRADDGTFLFNFWEATAGRGSFDFPALHGSALSAAAYPSLAGSPAPIQLQHFLGSPPLATCQTLQLDNSSGTAPLDWDVQGVPAWLSVSPNSGSLAAGGSVSISLCAELAPIAALAAGEYRANLLFKSRTDPLGAPLTATIEVVPLTAMPVCEDFESGSLPSSWTQSGTGTWRSQVVTSNNPLGGQHLMLDSSSNSSFSRNEVTFTADLDGWTGVTLAFEAKTTGDEAHGPPSSPFIDGADFDGIAINPDATSNLWYEIQGLRSLGTNYTSFSVDLDAAVAALGLSYGPRFQVRFNQYDNFSSPDDGIFFDSIKLDGTAPAPPLLPDLVWDSLSVVVVKPGSLSYTGRVRNAGTVGLSSNVQLQAYYSTDAILSTNDVLGSGLVSLSAATLVAGGLVDVQELDVPSSGAPTNYLYLLVVADAPGLIAESSELNNVGVVLLPPLTDPLPMPLVMNPVGNQLFRITAPGNTFYEYGLEGSPDLQSWSPLGPQNQLVDPAGQLLFDVLFPQPGPLYHYRIQAR